jgi:hypothetical protein
VLHVANLRRGLRRPCGRRCGSSSASSGVGPRGVRPRGMRVDESAAPGSGAVDDVVRQLDLEPLLNSRIATLSKGNATRAARHWPSGRGPRSQRVARAEDDGGRRRSETLPARLKGSRYMCRAERGASSDGQTYVVVELAAGETLFQPLDQIQIGLRPDVRVGVRTAIRGHREPLNSVHDAALTCRVDEFRALTR